MRDAKRVAHSYARDHAREFGDWVNAEAVATVSGAGLGFVFLMVLLFFNYQKIGGFALVTYAPLLALMVLHPFLRDLFAARVRHFSILYMDVVSLAIAMGAAAVAAEYVRRGIDIRNAPVQIALLIACALSFHPSVWRNVARNFVLTTATAAFLAVQVPAYAASVAMQFILGFFIGSLVGKYVLENREFRFHSVSTNQKMREHAYSQLVKIVYPHVVDMIQTGDAIEATMPAGQAEACVISFDIIGSSTVTHPGFPQAVERVMAACFAIMSENYSKVPLAANAYRIKDTGDGFLCSVGFPFQPPQGQSREALAVSLARRFAEAFRVEMEALAYGKPLRCAIGIASGRIEGFFPHAGPQQYDLRGRAIVLAKRYEAMRSQVIRITGEESASVLFIHQDVHDRLPGPERDAMIPWDATQAGRMIRDDGEARLAYYQFLAAAVPARAAPAPIKAEAAETMGPFANAG